VGHTLLLRWLMMGQERRRGRRISDLVPSSARRCRRILTSSLVVLKWGAIRIRVPGQMAPPRGAISRTGTNGVAYRNRRESVCSWPTPARCCPMPRTRRDARLQEVEADIADIKIRSRPSTRCTPLQHDSGGETVAYVRKVRDARGQRQIGPWRRRTGRWA
jgi:hypothetical protein